MNKTQSDVRAIVEELKVLYPDGICSLEYKKDYELLFSVRLAAQCTDERVNKVSTSTPPASSGPRPRISSWPLRCFCGITAARCPIPWRTC